MSQPIHQFDIVLRKGSVEPEIRKLADEWHVEMGAAGNHTLSRKLKPEHVLEGETDS